MRKRSEYIVCRAEYALFDKRRMRKNVVNIRDADAYNDYAFRKSNRKRRKDIVALDLLKLDMDYECGERTFLSSAYSLSTSW